MSETTKIPEGTEFILTVPLNRDRSKTATFYLKDIDEAIYLAAKDMIDRKKDTDAVRFIVKQLSLPGSDVIDKLGSFIAVQAASPKILELITPMDAELKKN